MRRGTLSDWFLFTFGTDDMKYQIKRFDELMPVWSDKHMAQSLIVDFTDVLHIKRHQLRKLLRLRKSALDRGMVLVLANIGIAVWGQMCVAGCDRMFFLTPSVADAENMIKGCVQTVDGIPELN